MCLQYNFDEIKRKIRKLKQFEIKIRFYDEVEMKTSLVWNEFFDLHEVPLGKAKYTLKMIAAMNRDEYKNMIDEYFYILYNLLYRENGITADKLFDPDALRRLNLPFHASEHEIKKKFREQVMKYHPDTGGDAAKFIELMTIYKELMEK